MLWVAVAATNRTDPVNCDPILRVRILGQMNLYFLKTWIKGILESFPYFFTTLSGNSNTGAIWSHFIESTLDSMNVDRCHMPRGGDQDDGICNFTGTG